ncbi:hypothetical protein EV401DRAFT_2061852 [Pisolithus croceorrhizus]|nr:hypothetical protein EV401DRAFT_2061852 [Pisolithus croceorrhizus]
MNGDTWTNAALNTAKFIGFRGWSTAFILDHEDLPVSKYGGAWTKSRIHDEDLKLELLTHLQSLGKYVMATAIIDYLGKPNVAKQYGLKKVISLEMAEWWMSGCGFHWTMAHGGQYVDGHERDDVVTYQQGIFLPAWYVLEPRMWRWSVIGGELVEEQAQDADLQSHVVACETPMPQPKGEGSSLMTADFVSADYGWLHSPDGNELARVLFCAGKGQDRYFSNDEIIHHAESMAILERYYQHEDHVFIFNNAPTQDANGKTVLGPDGRTLMTKVHISNGFFNGSPQEFYWPEGHKHAGKFKGMTQILTERGYDVTNLKAQCKHPDFINIETIMGSTCSARGFWVIYLPQFHWCAKWVYHCYPLSSKDADLEANVIKGSDSVPLGSMFAT